VSDARPAAAPADPIAAVAHPDPYPFYAELVARRPLYRDGALGLWVASSAETVSAVLASPRGRVRPAAEPVPAALVGTPAGEVFGRLVRMNDGAGHQPLKDAVIEAVGGVQPAQATAASARWAGALADRALSERGGLSRFAFALSAHVVGDLVGLPSDALDAAAAATGEFARCIAPGSGAEQVARGAAGAAELRDRFRAALEGAGDPARAGLLGALARAARRVGRPDPEAIVANGIGFLSQAYEATAGLIGNTLVALAREPGLLEEISGRPARLSAAVQEVLRHDPPVQNTRRFVAEDGPVAGQPMRAGDAVLVVLAAANRDPAANPDPARFDLDRDPRRTFGFGHGEHRCPGDALAAAIARAGVAALLERGVDPRRLPGPVRYRPSANARIPMLDAEGPA